MSTNSLIKQLNEESEFDRVFKEQFENSPVYKNVFQGTINTAKNSYRIVMVLSILMFLLGMVLVGVGIYLAFNSTNNVLPIVFSGIGSVSFIGFLLYKPIERVQIAVNNLIQSQIACLGYLAQYETLYRYLAANAQLFNSKDPNYLEAQMKCAKYLQDATSQIIGDLNSIEKKTQK